MKIKRTYKKLTAMLIVVAVMLTVFALSAMAGTNINADSSGRSFASSWSATKSGNGGNGSLTYGFNTFAFDEDKSSAYDVNEIHRAGVQQSGSTMQYGNWVNGGETSQKEIRHNNTPVYYMCQY
jgi:hypothetical protein